MLSTADGIGHASHEPRKTREMNSMKLRTTTLPALGLLTVLSLAGCAGTNDATTSSPGTDAGSSSTQADGAASTDSNDADVAFAMGMIPHHEQAVEMADTLLAKDGVDPDIAELARQITAAQQPEIDVLNDWLEDWDQPEGSEMGGMDHSAHGGMMPEGDMTALENAPGGEASVLFLEQMIIHHQGAIDMAETEVTDGENTDAVSLAEDIIETQSSEIERMQQLLAS